MKRILILLALAALLAPGWALAEGNINFILGGRGLDDDYWRPAEDHGVFGINFDFGKDAWPVNIAIGLYGSGGTEDVVGGCLRCGPPPQLPGAVIESMIGELSLGVLWRPETDQRFRPYLGGGVAFLDAEKSSSRGFIGASQDDQSSGLYVNGGLAWRIGRSFNVGLDARLVTGTDVTIFDEKGDADYFQLGVLLGYGW